MGISNKSSGNLGKKVINKEVKEEIKEDFKECVLYKRDKENRVRCTACAHRCLISEGKTGICAVRKNVGGKLILLVYGKIVAEHVDPIEKKPLYHFLPATNAYSLGTVGCNFKCGFCQNYDISQLMEVYGDYIKPVDIVNKAIKEKCKSIAYTYNEPTIFIEFVKDIATIAKKKGLKNVLVSNGYETKECMNFIGGFIDAMNIDLKGDNNFYKEHCKALADPVKETIKLAKEKGIWIEITTLLIPGENDSDENIEEIAKFISSIDKNIPWHISRFFPIYKMLNKEATNIDILKRAEEIGKKYLNYVYVGNVSGDSITICPNCKSKLIKRQFYNTSNNLKEGKCSKCGKEIAGVWK